MKKFYFTCAALLMSLLFMFTGCVTPASERVFNYLKDVKDFKEQSANSSYRVNLTVNDDLSFNLSLICDIEALKDYKAEGTKLEYLGCYEKEYTSEWMGVTQNGVSYTHVIKLNGADFEYGDKVYVFHLLANALSKKSDSYSLSLVYNEGWNSNFDDNTNLNKIISSQPQFNLKKK